MAQELTLKCAGLFTDPNPLGEIPAGAMRQAENIQIRRLGAAERRPGFTGGDIEAGVIEAIIPSVDTYSYLRDDGTQHWQTAINDEILVGGGMYTALSVSMVGTTITLTGDQAILDAFETYWPAAGTYITDVDAGYFRQGGTYFAADTLASGTLTVSPGQIDITIAPAILAPTDAFLMWPSAAASSQLTTALVPAGSTVIPIAATNGAPGASYHMGLLLDPTYFDPGTLIVAVDQTYGEASWTINQPTIANIPSSTAIQPYPYAVPTVVGNAGAIPSAYVLGETSWADMQQRQYLTLRDVLARYEGGGATTAGVAGVYQSGQPHVSTGTQQSPDEGWLYVGDMVGYRAVLGRYLGTQLVLGPPSAESFFSPSSAWIDTSAYDGSTPFVVWLYGRLPPQAEVGHFVQVYRTEVTPNGIGATSPGDEMRLVAQVTLDETDIARGYWDYRDTTPDQLLTGASLYTNETQQGALNANEPPPRVATVATYADMMFGGNVQGPLAKVLSLSGVPGVGDFDYGDASRIWPGTKIASSPTASWAAASPTVSLLNYFGDAPTVNTLIYDNGADPTIAGTYFQAGTYVTAVTPGVPGAFTLTLNQNTVAASPPGAGALSFRRFDTLFDVVGCSGQTSHDYFEQVTYSLYQGWDDEIGNYIARTGDTIFSAGLNFGAFTQMTAAERIGTIWYRIFVDQNPLRLFTADLCTIWRYDDQVDIDTALVTTVTITVGSPTITVVGVDARSAFAVGTMLADVDKYPREFPGPTVIPVNTEIIALSFVETPTPTLTITMSKNALANGNEFSAWDWIEIDGRRYFGVEYGQDVTPAGSNGDVYYYDKSFLWSFQALAWIHCYQLEYNWQMLGAGSETRSFIGTSTDIDAIPFVIKSCKPKAFADDVAAGVSPVAERYLNRLVWSKTQQPDAMPLPYFVDIGSASAAILRVLPTRDSLFVFKQDGAWRVTGYSPESLRIDEYDRTLRLMQPNALSQVDNNLIGWFTSGIMQITDAATNNLSDNAIGLELEALADVPSLPGAHWAGTWAFSAERDNEWLLIPGESGTPLNVLYVYNLVTGAWVKWTIANGALISCGVDLEGLGRLALGGEHENAGGVDYAILWQESSGGTDGNAWSLGSTDITRLEPFGYDGWYHYLLVVSDPGGSTLPKLGDQIFCLNPGQFYYVLSAVDTGTEYEITAVGKDIGADSTTSAVGTWSITANVVLEWVAKTAQNPGKRKFWREVNFSFAEFRQHPIAQLGFRTEHTSGAQINAPTPADRADAGSTIVEPYFLRALIPREAGRAVWLNPSINLSGLTPTWRLEACNLVYNWMGVRT